MSTELERWTVSDIAIMAEQVAKSRLFGMDQAQAFTLMALAQSEGIHPMKAVQRYHIIQGRPSMKSDAMLADFLRIGGRIQWITETDDCEKCEAILTHATFAPSGVTVRFTMANAKAAGLTNKDVWRQYPANMLRARVISTGIRMIAPGIVAGLYTPEETQEFMPEPKEHKAGLTQTTEELAEESYQEWLLDSYQTWIGQEVESVNQKWIEELTHKFGEIPRSGPAEIVRTNQLQDHLLEWSGTTTVDACASSWFHNKGSFQQESLVFCRSLWRKARAKVRAQRRTPREPGDDDGPVEDRILDQSATQQSQPLPGQQELPGI